MRSLEIIREVDKIRALNTAAFEVLGGSDFNTASDLSREQLTEALITVKRLVETAAEYAEHLSDCLTTEHDSTGVCVGAEQSVAR